MTPFASRLAIASILSVALASAQAQTTPPASPPTTPPATPPATAPADKPADGTTQPPARTPPQRPTPAERRRAATQATSEFPATWFFPQAGARFGNLIGKPAPAIRASRWIGSQVDLKTQIGNVVVVDFWGTWCGPCMKAIPHLVELSERRAKDGLVVIGVHDGKRGWNIIEEVMKNRKISYPVCIDEHQAGKQQGSSESVYRVSFWPTIAVIDRAGNVRAAGLQPDFVDEVVDILLKEPAPEGAKPAAPTAPNAAPATPEPAAPSAPTTPAPRKPIDVHDISTYSEAEGTRLEALKKLIGTTPTDIASPEWINTTPLTFADLKGKWVLLDYWATWCEPCKESIPFYNSLQKKYGDKLVVLGLCQMRGAEHMWMVARDSKIEFPIVRLMSEAPVTELNVDNFPDYYLIDPEGKIRLPDIRNEDVAAVLEMLVK